MDRAKRVVNEKHERILLEMTKQPGNDTCADCSAKGPRWASHNLGVFLCIRCGGLHRKMGTHISKVKSISLDSWTPEQIEYMRQWGNLKANSKWNPHPEFHPMPVNASDGEMERYIRNKYEKQIYRNHPEKPKQSTFSSSVPPPTPPRRAANDSIIKYNNERGNHDNALHQLKDMGFPDSARNREVLNTTNGDISAAVEILCRIPSGSAPSTTIKSSTISSTSNDDKLIQLWNMGFQDEAKNRDALRRGGNVEVAAALMIEARNTESLNNNAGSLKPDPSVNSQTEQDRMQIKLPISQSSNQSPQTSFQQSQTTTQNSSQNILGTFGLLSPGTDQPLTQQQQNKFDKNAILSLYNAPQSSINTSSNSFNSLNNGLASSGFGQQNQFSQAQQLRGVGFNSNRSILPNNTFENVRSSTPSGFSSENDLFGLNFNTSNSIASSDGSKVLNNVFGNRMNSETEVNDGNFISTTSNIPFRNNNVLPSNNNLFAVNAQQNSVGIRQNSSQNFGNVTPTSSFSLSENFTNATPDRGFGQLQQTTSSPSFAPNGQSNRLLLPQQQKNLFNSNTSSNTNQNQIQNQPNINHLFSTTNSNGLLRNTSSTDSGWPNMNLY